MLMCDGWSARGWPAGDTDGLGGWPVTGGRGQSGCAWVLHGDWHCMVGVVSRLPLHGKLLWRRLGTFY